MAVETVDVLLQVPKESKQVLDAALALVKHFKDGKSLADAAALLPVVMQAVDGWESIKGEVESDKLDELVGYAGHKVVETLRS